MNSNEYYSKEAIEKRVFGHNSYVGPRVEPHVYHDLDAYVAEIRVAAKVAVETGDFDFFQRVVYCLIRRVKELSYAQGIENTKADLRRKLDL